MTTEPPIAITVIGGYLGAGKTTLLNRLLAQSSDQRIGVVVNDFGELGIDAALLRAAADAVDGGDDGVVPVVNLANGCVCCTLGDDLRATLETLRSMDPPLDHIVIEASGVADPATAAAWGTVPGFAPGGVIVLAAADSVMRSARDRYVGSEVVRQLAGADLVLVTKTDLVDARRRSDVVAWIEGVTAAPIQAAPLGEVAVEVVLGRPRRATGRSLPTEREGSHGVEYVAWAIRLGPVADDQLRGFLERLPDGVLRAKGEVAVIEPSGAIVGRLVQVVGRTVSVTSTAVPAAGGIEAIGAARRLDPASLQQLADEYLVTR